MASVTFGRRRHVIDRFTNGQGAIVATRAGANNLGVIDPQHRQERRGAMAGLAHIAARDVADRFTHRCRGRPSSVVAAGAGANDMGVVYRDHGDEGCRSVARFANVGRVVVGGRLPGCLYAVMATHAVGDDALVIKARTDPTRSRMTGIAGLSRGDMVRSFAGGDSVVVATLAGPSHLGVVDRHHGDPCGGDMTRIAHRGRRNVRRRPPAGCRAVVATRAHPRHLGVVDGDDRHPAREVVAGFAGVGTADMYR